MSKTFNKSSNIFFTSSYFSLPPRTNNILSDSREGDSDSGGVFEDIEDRLRKGILSFFLLTMLRTTCTVRLMG
jgi:hypothetical protein